jgi:TPR repeat protein
VHETTRDDIGRGVEVDMNRAATLAVHACEGEIFEACTYAADLYERGKEIGKNKTLALELYQIACDAEVEGACEAAARLRP